MIKLVEKVAILQRGRSIESEHVRFECDACSDVGMVEVLGKGFRECECRARRRRETLIAAIPPAFRGMTLDDLVIRSDVHPMQADVIPHVKANREQSYVLAGDFGTGKTMLMWMLYRDAVDRGDCCVVVSTMRGLMSEIRAFCLGSGVRPAICAGDLRNTTVRYSLFIDDLDKDRPSEYANAEWFDIVNAVYEFQHQLVVTTNLRINQLVAYYDREDERYGGAIVRRIADQAKVVEMF